MSYGLYQILMEMKYYTFTIKPWWKIFFKLSKAFSVREGTHLINESVIFE